MAIICVHDGVICPHGDVSGPTCMKCTVKKLAGEGKRNRGPFRS